MLGTSIDRRTNRGAAQTELDPLFSALQADPTSSTDAIGDRDNLPPAQEPDSVKRDLDVLKGKFPW